VPTPKGLNVKSNWCNLGKRYRSYTFQQKKLQSEKFRLFNALKLEHLGRVNLIVGRNNAGKTCLLEALYLYAKNAAPQSVYQVISERGENWNHVRLQADPLGSEEAESPLRYLFYDYQFPEVGHPGIEIGPLNATADRLRLNTAAYELIQTFDGQRLTRVDEQQVPNNPLAVVEEVIEKNNEAIPLLRLNGESVFRPAKLDQPKLNVQMVSTKPVHPKTLAQWWDKMNVQPALRKEIFRGLQLIDENICEVVLVGYLEEPNKFDNMMPILIFNNSDKKLPITNLGEGLSRLFYLLLALVNAPEGLLLIDEFENGLHYAVQPQVWELIFNFAKENDIQVFATTHSWDCVRAFHSVWETQKEQGSFYRLDNEPDDGVSVMPYDCETLGDVLEINGEMR
jgi:ABC-type lipoprotein export system ATPase subunit